MSNLDEQLAEIRARNGSHTPMPAARTEWLKPEAYLDDAEGRPLTPILIGLRTPRDSDYTLARQAESEAECMLILVSVGICDPNDCRRAHQSFPTPNDQIPVQLKPQTIRYLYDRIEQLHLETSPTVPLASDEELYLLGDALQLGEQLEELEKTNLPAANRVRRLASVITEALGVLSETHV